MPEAAADSWQANVLASVADALADEPRWSPRLADPGRGVHLAVMVEPYLSLLLCGVKTVESRFSATRRDPWGRVAAQDLLLLKRAAGPVVGIAEIGTVRSFELGPAASIARLRREFGPRIRAAAPFWDSLANARYATLLEIARVAPHKSVNCHKHDRRAWVVLRHRA